MNEPNEIYRSENYKGENYKSEKSKKLRHNNVNKKELWNIFDSEIENEYKSKYPLECIYRACGNREFCDNCETILAF